MGRSGKIHWSDGAKRTNLGSMKAVIVFLIVVILGFGFVQLVSWLESEPPRHVMHVKPPAKPN